MYCPYKDNRTEAEWAQLLLDLMRLDGQAEHDQQGQLSQPLLRSTSWLVNLDVCPASRTNEA